MKRSSLKILFLIKKSRELKNGETPIFLRITVNGDRTETTIKRYVKEKNWDPLRQKIKGNSEESNSINDYLQSIRMQLYSYQKDFEEKGKEVTARNLSNAFLGIDENKWRLLDLFQKHNDEMKLLIGIDYSPLTLQRYETAVNHLKIYLKKNYNKEDISLMEIDLKFIKDFEFYLKVSAKCQHNSAMKHVKSLKKIINLALANDFIRKNPFAAYKMTTVKTERNHLTEQELETIYNHKFDIRRLEVIKDLFIFQCYSGLAYKDLSQLEQGHIQIGMDNKKWIYMKRAKTGVSFKVPLFEIHEKIIAKYSDSIELQISGKLLPVPSNQKMNAYLKEIATICKVDKNLNTHQGRHTYATTVMLSNGIPIESVSKLLGHTKILTTQIYAKVLETKVTDEIQFLREKLIG